MIEERLISPTMRTEIEHAADDLLGGKQAGTVSRFRTVVIMERLAHRVNQQARRDVLFSLLTVADVARQFGVTPGRIRAKAIWLRNRGFNAGWQIPGTKAWLFTPEELENLRPLPEGKKARVK